MKEREQEWVKFPDTKKDEGLYVPRDAVEALSQPKQEERWIAFSVTERLEIHEPLADRIVRMENGWY